MSANPPPPDAPPQGQGYPPAGQPGYPNAPPPYPGAAVPPYQQYQAPLPGQPGYQWGGAVPAYPYASFWMRVGSAVIDRLIVLLILAAPIAIGVILIANSVDTDTSDDSAQVTNGGLLAIGILVIVIGAIIGFLYEPILTARQGVHNGQTFGRQAVGTRITNLQGGPITVGQAWGRYLFRQFVIGSIAGAFTGGLAVILNYLWMLWDSSKQCWHDKIANTLVLRA